MAEKIKKLYLIRIPELNLCKIGISVNPNKRIKQLQTGCPYKLEITKTYSSSFINRLEKNLHLRFSHFKIDENIHNLSGEWFNVPIKDIVGFNDICTSIEKNFNLLKENKNHFI